MKKINFSMIAGYEGEKQNLQNISTMFQKTNELKAMNVRLPRGILLVGEAGVGKTMLAKALINTSAVNCVTLNGGCIKPEEDTMRYITLKFEEAKDKQPAIIFIDELDKILQENYVMGMLGNKFSNEVVRGLLKAIDNHLSDAITVVATANDLDSIPDMLIRSGRFDRIIEIPKPNISDRRAIVEYYTRNLNLSPDIDLNVVVNLFAGNTGADIESVLNQAGLEAVANGMDTITMENINSAIDSLVFCGVVRNEDIDEEERRVVAIHEAGHLVVSLMTDKETVSTASILPQGRSLGHVNKMAGNSILRRSDTAQKKIVTLLAGKANEELYMPDKCYFGAERDIQQAYNIANNIVTNGCMNIEHFCQAKDGIHSGYRGNISKMPEIEEKILSIVTESAEQARTILRAYERLSDIFIEALLEKSVLSREEIMEIFAAYQRGDGTLVR